jgi:hypothetical protein
VATQVIGEVVSTDRPRLDNMENKKRILQILKMKWGTAIKDYRTPPLKKDKAVKRTKLEKRRKAVCRATARDLHSYVVRSEVD